MNQNLKCEDCRYSVGWTRYIRRVQAGKKILCWSCALKRKWRFGRDG